MRIAMAQTKPVTGDLEGNVRQITEGIRKAKADGADIVVLPETAITGYCCGALFEDEDFIRYNKRFLEEIIAKEVPQDMVAVVGFVDLKGYQPNGKLDITNSCAVIQGGKVIDIYDKILLANDNHHEDRKYFTPGSEVKVTEVEVKGQKITLGTPLCEDAWRYDHSRDIIEEMKEKGAELILCPNFSYFHAGKEEVRHELFSEHAKEKQIPIFVMNAAGIGDIVKNIMIYDGGSMAFNNKGELIAHNKRFSTDYQLVDLETATPKPFTPEDWRKETVDSLVFEQREMFNVLGIKNAQVHMSGGIDSAFVGAVVVEAMTPEHTVFISNPTEDNGDYTKGNATFIAKQLGTKLYWNPTQLPYEGAVAAYRKAYGEEPSAHTRGALQAVLRTAQGNADTGKHKSAIVATGNHTEIVLGWATFHDIGSIGVHAPIGDLTKSEIFQLSEYINERWGKEVVPVSLFNGQNKPAAELADAKEDPIDYLAMSGICAEMIRNRMSPRRLKEAFRSRTLTPEWFPQLEMYGNRDIYNYTEQEFDKQVDDAFRMSKGSVYKAAQGAPVVILHQRSRGFSNRETIINRYKGSYEVR